MTPSTRLSLALAIALAACAPPARQAGGPGGAVSGAEASGGGLPAALADVPADRLIDLSHPYDDRTVFWPTAPPFRLTRDAAGTGPGGYWYASNSICLSEHGGTHLDAPYHFAKEGWTTDRISLTALIGPARVIDIRQACASDPDHAATAQEIRDFETRHGAIPAEAIVVLWTGWGERWPDRRRYLGDDTPGDASRLHFPGLSAEAARVLAERRVAGVGIDTASIDPGNSRDFQAHRILAAANVYNLENLAQVDRLPPTGATLIALPMKIAGGTGGPVRVVAILP